MKGAEMHIDVMSFCLGMIIGDTVVLLAVLIIEHFDK